MLRTIAAALLTVALAAPAFAQEAQVEAQGDADALPPIEQSVGATINETDRMLVSVTIANSGPYPFIVDTAAERTVVARQLAEQLQIIISIFGPFTCITCGVNPRSAVKRIHAKAGVISKNREPERIAYSLCFFKRVLGKGSSILHYVREIGIVEHAPHRQSN